MLPLRNRLHVLSAVCVCVAMVGCGVDQPPPSQVMNAYYEAAKNKDGVALKGLVSAGTLKSIGNSDVPVERVLVAMTERVPATTPEVRNEKIDGSRATLEVRNAETNTWDTAIFVMEEGTWKMALDEMIKARRR